jgi:hypothetical protein
MIRRLGVALCLVSIGAGSSIRFVVACGGDHDAGDPDAMMEAEAVETAPPVTVDCFGTTCTSPNACCLTADGGSCLDAGAVSGCQAAFPCIPGASPQCSFSPPNVLVPNACSFCASSAVTLDDAGIVSLVFPVETVCDDIPTAPSCPATCVDLDASCPDAAGTCTPITIEGTVMPFGLCL